MTKPISANISFFNHTTEYVFMHAKKFAITSLALKLISYVSLCFSFISPLYISIFSLTLFTASIYIDYKLLSNFSDLVIAILRDSSKNSYESGFFSGRMLINFLRVENRIQYMKGFFAGMKLEWYS